MRVIVGAATCDDYDLMAAFNEAHSQVTQVLRRRSDVRVKGLIEQEEFHWTEVVIRRSEFGRQMSEDGSQRP